MRHTHVRHRTKCPRRARRGAVTVELALVCSLVFLPLFLGMLEASRMYNTHNELSTAIRSGARLACMDRDGLLNDGQTTNQKIIQDIRNMLNASGLPGDDVEVYIADWWEGFDASIDPLVDFDLDNAANDRELFQVRVKVPYSAMNPYLPPEMDSVAFDSFIVLRNARASIVQ